LKVFLVSLAIFLALIATLALGAFLFLADTSPMGKFEYLYEIGRLNVFRYTGIGTLNDREIRLVYEGRCTRKCHSRDVVERASHTAREWEGIIGRMREVNKARVTRSEAGIILSYLAKRYGSNIPTILTPEGGKYLKKYLWRSDFGESDLYVDVIYTPIEYFNFIGGSSEVEGYRADRYTLFKVYLNTHQNKLAPFPLDQLAILKSGQGTEYRPVQWKVTYESADNHHREGILVFDKMKSGSTTLAMSLRDLPGQKERVFQWELPIPEKP
jgi:hypothetical protein